MHFIALSFKSICHLTFGSPAANTFHQNLRIHIPKLIHQNSEISPVRGNQVHPVVSRLFKIEIIIAFSIYSPYPK